MRRSLVESTLPLAFCVIVFFVGFGLLQLFARDLMWELTQRSNQIAGRASERTDTWDSWQQISGVLFILLGVGLGCWVWSANAERNAQIAQVTAIYETIEADQTGEAARLDAAFGAVIPTLHADAWTQSQRVRAVELGLSGGGSTEIEYGFCDSDETFYVFILNYPGRHDGYAYLPLSDPSYCRPPNWYFSDVERLGDSTLGGAWYTFDFPLGLGRPATSTPARAPTRTPAITATATAG
jgi:hypothetical protein